ncbi:DUF736 domain-containing protein [Martelella mediterranea]|uniref:Uncharacterized protein (DUF736 family) n=1 Tax=Martelella mediterranea TaxID=293089 RepID=A0A4R3NEE0_9HYPH|nr:DUF736 family protein [Martelella mediterranea]TCT29721.1 uncharacterized protein (DUF736 family) [Martelella mediterranea]
MADLINFIRFNDNGTLEGNIAALDFDFDITGEELNSTNPKAPVYRLYGVSPRGRKIEVGGIWRQTNQNGEEYLQLTAATPSRAFRANLGKFPGQDDGDLMTVIPWS